MEPAAEPGPQQDRLPDRMRCMHTVSMPNVLIRDLAPEVHAVLTRRALAAGQSLQQDLTGELTRLARRPTNEELFDRIEAWGDGVDLSDAEVLAALHGERRPRS